MIESKLDLEGGKERAAVELIYTTQNYQWARSPAKSKKGNRWVFERVHYPSGD